MFWQRVRSRSEELGAHASAVQPGLLIMAARAHTHARADGSSDVRVRNARVSELTAAGEHVASELPYAHKCLGNKLNVKQRDSSKGKYEIGSVGAFPRRKPCFRSQNEDFFLR